ncbi:MAG: hypothetical protein KJN69_00425 [Gammaproteobacteria bacterium]|nr:hypothetical protein [Gammaproteobacteria bacterium]
MVFILALAISAQPLQAGFCDIGGEKNPETAHHMEQSKQVKHDCCGSDDSDASEGCDGNMDCGVCFVSVYAIPSLSRINAFWAHPYLPDVTSGVIPPSHTSPPFRPPIS